MFRSLAIVSLATSVAMAVIPSGISDGCSSFLKNLNTNTSSTTCFSALSTAISDYTPGSPAAASPSAAKIGSTLSNFCSSSVTTSCPESLIRSQLTDFYSACSAELASNMNEDVLSIYDVLYAILPFRTASCAQDDSGNYCAIKSKLPSSGQTPAQLQAALMSSSSSPNFNTFGTNNIPFLFLSPSLASSDLCNVCTRNVMTAYLNFEAKVPYAPGLGNSLLLKGQTDLYSAITSTCGSTFLSGAGVQAAGGLSGGTLHSGGVLTVAKGQGIIAAALGALAVIVSSAF
ncbi:hypothetical protein J132_09356 [Termitomyces sp. J132]|nr:hypothetical protein J132_09356 [Termitomyces sp. J132]